MFERPIIFSSAMREAIIRNRKTQTRRAIPRHLLEDTRCELLAKDGDKPHYMHSRDCSNYCDYACGGYFFEEYAPRYGCVGHYLWVRNGRYAKRTGHELRLQIVRLDVQRIHSITLDDCVAEGLVWKEQCIRDAFIELWDHLNAQRGYGWTVNPWVWVVTFKLVRPAGDDDGKDNR